MSERLGDMIEAARNGQPRHQTHPSDNKADRVFVSEGTRKMARGQDAGPDADGAMSAEQVRDTFKNLTSRLALIDARILELNCRLQTKGLSRDEYERSKVQRNEQKMAKMELQRQLSELRPKLKTANVAESAGGTWGQQIKLIEKLVASAQRQEQLLMCIGQMLAKSLGLKDEMPAKAE
jgi:hypothetical protein